MAGYIIIMSTHTQSSKDLENLSQALDSFLNVMEWSIDLMDCDKVLRIEASTDITLPLIDKLKPLGIECYLMGVFKRLGAI